MSVLHQAIQLENCNEHSLLWKKFIERYILTLLDDGLNKSPPHENPISDMAEKMLVVKC